MKKASAILYLIGAIIAAITFVGGLIVAILGLAGVITELKFLTTFTNDFKLSCVSLLISSIFSGAAALLGFHGYKLSNSGSPKTGFHVFMLIIAILGWDILLILASIFGLVAAEQPRK